MNGNRQGKTLLEDVRYVKLVTIGSINPNNPVSDKSKEEQVPLLNRSLNDFAKGIIIGKDSLIEQYVVGEHELMLKKSHITWKFQESLNKMDKTHNYSLT